MRSRLRQEPGGLRNGSDGHDAQLDRRRHQHPELPVRRAGGYGGGSKGDNENRLGYQPAPGRFQLRRSPEEDGNLHRRRAEAERERLRQGVRQVLREETVYRREERGLAGSEL